MKYICYIILLFISATFSVAASTPLTRDGYVKLAKELMEKYGTSSGQRMELDRLLESTDKPTDGSDLGGMFMITGAGSASVYVTAWSAGQNPDDLLTANNLGVALKDMGELSLSLRVLIYGLSLNPNSSLIYCNLGWVNWEAGNAQKAAEQFEKALAIDPDMVSANLGLGLSLNSMNKDAEAQEYLHNALKKRHSAMGMVIYQQSNNDRPLAEEKSINAGLDLPELPIHEDPQNMALERASFENYANELNSRAGTLSNRLIELSDVIRNQQERTMQDPDNSLVYQRDFATEIMHFEDIMVLLFGEPSAHGQALYDCSDLRESSSEIIVSDINPRTLENADQAIEKMKELEPLFEELARCGGNELCEAKVQQKIDLLLNEVENYGYAECKLLKQQLDLQLIDMGMCNRMMSETLNDAVDDFYAFTDPILEKIYAPSLNEFYNVYREVIVLTKYEMMTRALINMSEISAQYRELECVDPGPPDIKPAKIKDKLTKKKEGDCILGDGIKFGISIISFELTCTHVQISGGKGLLGSMKRDFATKETTLWIGAGAKVDAVVASGEASVGVEITIGSNSSIKDVAFTSTLKAEGMGKSAELAGRVAAVGGPSITTASGTKWSIPGL